jgi:hypothetical protein
MSLKLDLPRGKYSGLRLGDPPASESEHSSAALPAVAVSIPVISAKCSSTKARSHTRCRINRNDSRTHA